MAIFSIITRQNLKQVIGHVAGSPSFTSKLLYAAQVTLVETSGVTDEVKANSRAFIDDVVMSAHKNSVTQAELIEFFSLLKECDGKNNRLKKQFTSEQAMEWLSRIEGLISKR